MLTFTRLLFPKVVDKDMETTVPQCINNFVYNEIDDMDIAAEIMTHDNLIKLDINSMGYRQCSCYKLTRYNKLMRNFAGLSPTINFHNHRKISQGDS